MTKWRDAIRPLVGAIVAAFFVWLTFEQLNWTAFRHSLTEARLTLLAAALLLLTVDFSLRIIRWWWMLRVFEPDLPLANCVGPLLAGFAVNNLLPFRVGDVFRAVGFRRELKSPIARTLATVFVERLLDVAVLVSLLLFGLLRLPAGVLPDAFIRTAFWFAVACLFIIMTALMAPRWVRQWISWIQTWPALARAPFAIRLFAWTAGFLDTLVALNSPKGIAQLVGLSILVWTFEGALFASALAALAADADPFGPWFALATGTLATVLPSTPGYVGTFDYFATVGLMAYGARKAPAVAFSLLVHLLLWLPITLAGVCYLLVAPMGRSFWWRVRVAQNSNG